MRTEALVTVWRGQAPSHPQASPGTALVWVGSEVWALTPAGSLSSLQPPVSLNFSIPVRVGGSGATPCSVRGLLTRQHIRLVSRPRSGAGGEAALRPSWGWGAPGWDSTQ